MFAGTELAVRNPSCIVLDGRNLKEIVIKLRWMGLDGEAENLSCLLGPDEAVVGPIDTD